MKTLEPIIINQLGYRTKDYKIAYITGYPGQFQIINVTNNQIVWAGKSTTNNYDRSSGEKVSKLDFTSLDTEGEYIIQGDCGRSLPFSIHLNDYQPVHHAVLKAFYFFRCGTELSTPYAGQWGHLACHTTPAIIFDEPTKTIDGNGGWHDAGDYGKYIVAAGKAVADLLLAYEYYPQSFQYKIPLPESNDQMIDLLHEVKYELTWMLKMQNKQNGGVYHKLTTLHFPGYIMPEDDVDPLYVMPISSTATASFAATLAYAARIYKSCDEAFSTTCLEAAKLAWSWLQSNPDFVPFNNPDAVATGEYGDTCDLDERYWAAAELYRTTGHPQYHDAFKHYAHSDLFNKFALGWADMGGYGTISYLSCEHPTDAELANKLKSDFHTYANQLVTQSNQDGFSVTLTEDQYVWGSNMEVLNHAMLLLIAQHIEKHSNYKKTITAHLHYILGANINRYSYISGFGQRAMKFPHHRPSVADNIIEPVPGLVSGGPNRNLQDPQAKKHCKGKASAACFIDHVDSYSTNEVTIYWNSPALFLLSAYVT